MPRGIAQRTGLPPPRRRHPPIPPIRGVRTLTLAEGEMLRRRPGWIGSYSGKLAAPIVASRPCLLAGRRRSKGWRRSIDSTRLTQCMVRPCVTRGFRTGLGRMAQQICSCSDHWVGRNERLEECPIIILSGKQQTPPRRRGRICSCLWPQHTPSATRHGVDLRDDRDSEPGGCRLYRLQPSGVQ